MKNFAKLFVSVAVLFAGFACATDATEDLGVAIGGQTTLTVSLEESRTQLGDKAEGVYPLHWSANDQISVNGVASNALSNEEAGAANATFTFAGQLEHPYSVIYPAASANEVVFPASQVYTEGTFAVGAAPMYGYAANAGEAIQMHHLAGALRFDVTGAVVLSSLTVEAENGNFAGTYAVDCTTGALTLVEGTASSKVTLSLGEGLALGTTATPLYVAVPAGEYGMVSATLTATSGEKMVAKFDTSAKAISAGKVREFAPFAFVANVTEGDVIEIDSKEALIAFAAAPTKSAKVTAAIDMTGVEWAPIEDYGNFTFDGGNFEIKGLTAPLFGTTSANIKNVKLVDVAIVETESYAIGEKSAVLSGALAYHLLGGSVDNCYASGSVEVNNTTHNATEIIGDYYDVCLGGMIGILDGATMTNCENRVNVTVTSMWNDAHEAGFSVKGGAMIGMIAGGSSITDSENYGNFTYNAKHTKTKGHHLGAMTGGSNVSGAIKVFKKCTNHGDITVSEGAIRRNAFYVGGVSGYLNGSAEEISHLTNLGCGYLYGAGNGQEYRVGGIAGSINSVTSNLVNGSATDATKGCFIIKNDAGTTKCGNVYLAGMAYSTGGFKISNCTNYGALTIEGETANTYLGGLLGTLSCGDIYKCSNYGTLTHNLTTVATVNIGGILAQAYVSGESTVETPLTVEGCENHGAICYNAAAGTTNSGLRVIGGLVGYGNAKNNLITYTVKDCVSAGTMVFVDQSEATTEVAYGGAFAYPQYGKEVYLTNVKVSAKMYTGSNVDLKTGVATPIANHTEGGKFKMSGMCAMFTKHTVATDCDFSGLMQVDSKFTVGDSVHFGGYGGYGAGRYDIIDSTFSGTINYSENCSASGGFVDIAGFLGYAAHSDASMVQTCTNSGVTKTGVIRVAGDVTNAKALYVGGMIAYTGSKNTDVEMYGCYNLGSITLTKDVETNGGVYVGGIYGSRTSSNTSSNLIMTGCYNEGDITVDAKAAVTMCIGGLCSYTNMICAATTAEYPKFYNKGNIKVGTNLPEGTKAEYTTKLEVGGFIGIMNNNVTKNFDANFQNDGEIVVKNVTTPELEVGGVWALMSKAPTIKSGVVLTNTGDITVSDCTLTDANTFVGGIVGKTATAIAGAQSYCTINSGNLTNVGWIMGSPRASATLATNCQIGGHYVVVEKDEEDETMKMKEKPLEEDNYYNYIYGNGQNTDWSGVDNYDGCTLLSAAPSIQ